jgi:hypothetical protein
MFASTLPSITALESNHDDQLTMELRLGRLRTQVAVVRTLADQIELLVSRYHVEGLSEQLIEEMARLGCGLFEAAADFTKSPAWEDSGVFDRRPAMPAALVGRQRKRDR